MGYFQVRYDSRVVNYNRRGFIRLATGESKRLFEKFLLCLMTSADLILEKIDSVVDPILT